MISEDKGIVSYWGIPNWDIFGIGIAMGIGIETEWPTPKSIPIPIPIPIPMTRHILLWPLVRVSTQVSAESGNRRWAHVPQKVR